MTAGSTSSASKSAPVTSPLPAHHQPIPSLSPKTESKDIWFLDSEAKPEDTTAVQAVVNVVADEHKRLEEPPWNAFPKLFWKSICLKLDMGICTIAEFCV